MTDATLQTPPIEKHRLNDADATELERQVGSLVAEVYGGDPLQIQAMHTAPHDEACRQAADLVKRHPTRIFAVFKLSRTFHAVCGQVPAQEAPA